jgi:hypothetical protein
MIKSFYLFILVVAITFCSCSPGVHYSAEAYQRDTAIETKALEIVKKTSESYSLHAAEIEALKTEIDNALAEERKRKMNQATVKMWESVQQDKGNLYDLFQLWKTNDTLSPAIADEITKKIERLLGSITELENHKIKS